VLIRVPYLVQVEAIALTIPLCPLYVQLVVIALYKALFLFLVLLEFIVDKIAVFLVPVPPVTIAQPIPLYQ